MAIGSGRAVDLFGFVIFEAVDKQPWLQQLGATVHAPALYGICGILMLHVCGAIKHHIAGGGELKRMLTIRK